jgi:3-deoxy-manno-octulosonate cytidylyltransferase (CMP-KDO synthetase)
LIDPVTIDRAVNALLNDPSAQMSTTCEPISEAAEVLNKSVVKVTIDGDGYATNFSRNPIPYPNQAVQEHGSIEAALGAEPALLFSFRKHTGLYAIVANSCSSSLPATVGLGRGCVV